MKRQGLLNDNKVQARRRARQMDHKLQGHTTLPAHGSSLKPYEIRDRNQLMKSRQSSTSANNVQFFSGYKWYRLFQRLCALTLIDGLELLKISRITNIGPGDDVLEH